VQALSGVSTTAAGAAGQFGPALQVSARIKDTYFSYRVGAQYDVTENVMAFATYTRGYKGPAVNDGATSPGTTLVVQPEVPKSGEVGFKATLAGGRAAFNVTGFYTEVSNFQAQFFDSAIPAFVFGNAPKLTSKGVTANLFGRPTKGLLLNLGLTYNDAKYGAGYFVANAVNAVTDAQGKQLVSSPKWKITASGEYSTAIGSNADAFVQADIVYKSRTFSNAANDAILSTKGAAIFGGRVGIRFDDERYGVSVFARNIFDTFRPTARFATPVAAQQLDPASYSQFSGPEAHRLVGLSFDARF